jgi:putative ABC transport system permease protein
MLLLKLAIRNILRQKRRSFLTGISMALGLVMGAITLSVVEGSYGAIVEAFTEDRTGHVQIHAGDYLDRPSLYKQIKRVDEVVAKVEKVSGVISATPRIYAPSLGFANEKTAPAFVTGIDPVTEGQTTTILRKKREGNFLTGVLSKDGYDFVMIGRALAKSLNLSVGDELVLIGQGVDGSIANDIYLIGAIIGSKEGAERQNVYMSLDAARRYLTMGPSAHEIALITDSPDRAEKMALAVTEALDDEDLSVDPWQVVEAMFYNAMKADQDSNRVTSAIIMAMVAIGVLNAVLMSVLERTREYGLLRAIGTRPRQVFAMIVVETMMLGILASIVGVLLSFPILDFLKDPGIPLPNPIDMGGMSFDAIVARVSFYTIAFPVGLVLTTAFLVSLWPAVRSARITPIAALGAT